MTRQQQRVLDQLARAGERGRVLSTDELGGALIMRPLRVLRALEARRYARVVDASARPYLWRVTLAGLAVARYWRERLP